MKAVVLLSGGIDSATTLYCARSKGHTIYCLTFDYGQRHGKEIISARRIAKAASCDWMLLKITMPWKGSALLDKSIRLDDPSPDRRKIPNTYVPARNIIFLSYAASYAESIGARRIFIGANQIDYSGYPDCRGSFIRRFEAAVHKGTKAGVEGGPIRIMAPLLHKGKKDIIRMAARLKVPLRYTWSCYKGAKYPCMRCDSCIIREAGFKAARIEDPIAKR